MKIKKISIENYRFFKDKELIKFKNRNILLYGENGSGKTSLFNALQDFFFYYKDESKSKLNIEDNKNIFSADGDEPKITIKFSDNSKIIFDKNGFGNNTLKVQIEQVRKSKLFLTYHDIYAINNIFKKDISYKEFREIFTILYYDELDNKFSQFENYKNRFESNLKDTNNEDLLLKYNLIFESVKSFDFESVKFKLSSEWKVLEDTTISTTIIENAYYLPIEKIDILKETLQKSKFFIELCEELKVNIKDDYWLITELEDIIDKLSDLLKENDRFKDDYTVENKLEFEGLTSLDTLIDILNNNITLVDDYVNIKDMVYVINNTIYNKLTSRKDSINNILNYLKINLEVNDIIQKDYMFYALSTFKIYSVDFKIELSGKELKEHWSNLNEAKLSALNFAIYLSSILQKKPDISILVLDDLLIGLDMSNRDKMIDLLLDRTKDIDKNYKFLDDEYQMFIFTHDKAFFEMAKYKFDNQSKGKWEYIEMYEDSSGKFPKPLLMPSKCHFEKAKSYFKLCDYPTAGNYLRKASEAIMKDILLDTYFKEIEKPTLDPMIKMYKKMCTDFNLESPDCILKLEELTKRVFNPSSHDDLISPLYKKEIDDAIQTVKDISQLQKIERKKIINSGSMLQYQYESKYKARYNFLGDINLYTYNNKILNRNKLIVGNCGYAIYEDDSWNEQYFERNSTPNLKDIFTQTQKHIKQKYLNEISVDDFISHLKIDNNALDEEVKKLINRQCTGI